MEGFTDLERAVVREIGAGHPEQQERLHRQLATARISSRENTDAGFYTKFEVDRAMLPLTVRWSPIGNIVAGVEGTLLRDGFSLGINHRKADSQRAVLPTYARRGRRSVRTSLNSRWWVERTPMMRPSSTTGR